MKKITTIVLLFIWSAAGYSQQIDTTGIYGERKDSLDAAVFTERNPSNYLSKGKEIRTEIISADGLMKMACCNLGESFENSASVTVGYSDATTGARQIRLLGLSGAYTQMLDENRPAMRGIAAPFGLSYVPGPWMESIQVAKGSPSLVNGSEAVTGSINMEFRKPTDSKPLYVQASVMDDTKTDVNILSSLDLGKGFYTIIMGHADGNFRTYDMNGDGFADDPRMAQFNLSNRWLYYTPELQLRWGVKALRDSRKGGQIEGPWTSDVTNSSVNAYFKAGKALREDNSASIALVGDYSWHQTESFFGHNAYTGGQHSA
ncbi:MAG: TonB-dependent receptor plug domain-containing protein, partial [Bacteroidales bacterium]|nr:TonB-dependent receptor plug domain-containing protein [Bacteroidales bacterium]